MGLESQGSFVYSESVSLDKHRDSLAKYCYDLSKVVIAITVVNPIVTKTPSLVELAVGLLWGLGLLSLAILIERGKPA